LRVQSLNTHYPAAVKSILDFWIPTESALKSKNHLAMCSFES
jgi:hypothetical protein